MAEMSVCWICYSDQLQFVNEQLGLDCSLNLDPLHITDSFTRVGRLLESLEVMELNITSVLIKELTIYSWGLVVDELWLLNFLFQF